MVDNAHPTNGVDFLFERLSIKTALLSIRPVLPWVFFYRLTVCRFTVLFPAFFPTATLFHQQTLGVTFQVIVLATLYGPDQHADHDQAKEYHAGNQGVDDVHYLLLLVFVNRLRMRAALPTTSSELMGMVMAATSGVIIALMAKGIMMRL